MSDGHDHRDGHGDEHHHHHHHGDHEHGQGGGGHRGGPPFLQLELSRVIAEEGASLAGEVARELLREAIRDRVRERMGDRIREAGRIVADQFVDDNEANFVIEAAIGAREESRRTLDQRVRDALHGKKG